MASEMAARSESGDDDSRRMGAGASAVPLPPFFQRLHPVKTDPDFDPGELPVRVISGEYWRQSSPSYPPLSMPHRATSRGRWHMKGRQPRLYASSTRDAAWGELFRHSFGGVSPFEMKRRMTRLAVMSLPVLDLTNASVRRQLGVTEQELTGERYRACQLIASLVRRRPDRFGGILAPSAAAPDGAETLVIFAEWSDHVTVRRHRIARAPIRLLGLYERLIGTFPLRYQDEAMQLLRDLRDRVRARLPL
jgi:RES domain-containing protein